MENSCKIYSGIKAHSDTSPDKQASTHNAIVWFPIETVKQAASPLSN